MTVLSIIFGVLIGACAGSFLGCAAYRLPRRISLNGRSACPGCGAPVPARRNLPVLAFVLQRGRSACCHAPLRASYLLFELACAAVGGVLGLVAVWLPFAVVTGLLAAGAVIDALRT